MSLRAKLLLVALSVLVLPWAGWQLLRQMESLLRQGEQQALTATAEALARALAQDPDVLPEHGPSLYVHTLARPPRLDADGADWAAVEPRAFRAEHGATALRLSLGRVDDTLYVLADARVSTPRPADAHWRTAAHSDHLLLQVEGRHGTHALRLANATDGPVRAVNDDGAAATLGVHGHWRRVDGGFIAEWQLPQGLWPKRLGLQLVDALDDGRLRRAGTAVDAPRALWSLTRRDQRLAQPIAPLLPGGMRARLLDADGWVLSEAGGLPPAPSDPLPWWRRQLYRHLIHASDPLAADESDARRSDRPEVWQALSGLPATAWRRDHDAPRLLLSAAVPMRRGGEVRGAVLLEREQQSLLFTDRALGGLLGSTLLALFVAGAVVFLFASRLSWRIRRLARATESALTRDGRVQAFPASDARDEIGDLSRRFARLLDEIATSQEYLRSLAGKLSHELNTPIAIVRGALDNIEASVLDAADRQCVERARNGADRLAAIVRAMSEASRIEHAIGQAEAETVDLRALLAGCAEGYRALLVPRPLQLELPDAALPLHCAPDLVVQALDKLIDNARSFTPDDGWVRIRLQPSAHGAQIAVANRGPRLPESMQHRLFDSMVSLRPARRGDVHLGFGLYVVRLIAELHRGSVRAHDLADGDGVEFVLQLGALPRRS